MPIPALPAARPAPVSYTHLDVYKRQVEMLLMVMGMVHMLLE